MKIRERIAENERRNAELHSKYDPYVGIGSHIDRVRIPLGFSTVMPTGTVTDCVYIPQKMIEECPVVQDVQRDGLSEWARKNGYDTKTAESKFNEVRYQYDFEFWCVMKARIRTKKGEIVPFILNRPQRIYVARMEAQREARKPVRITVLKHRQWGCTTVSFTYIAWHQIELWKGRDSWFVGLNKDGADDVRNRYDVIREGCGLHLVNYDSGGTTKKILERDCLVSIGTVEKPNAPSGRPAQFVHLFEVGKWPSNNVVSAERVFQNVGAMMVDQPGTVQIVESTAQASTGTYFKAICDRARAGKLAYDFLFVSWIDDPQYARPIESGVDEFVASWSEFPPGVEYAETLWELGATLEQINWYLHQSTKEAYIDLWRLMEEFPSTADEAFQTGGKRVFPIPHVLTAKKTCRAPSLIGNLVSEAETGAGALRNIAFEPAPRGPLSVWRKPDDDYGGLLKSLRISNRFIIGVDIGPGTWEGADYHDGTVIDRAPILFGGFPEVVAEWHGHLDKDLFAWQIARVAAWYDDALLAVEVNSLIEDNETRYDGSLTILDTLSEHYANLYIREVYDASEQKMTDKLGFHMNPATKGEAIDQLKRGLREAHNQAEGLPADGGLIERCFEACNEYDTYLHHEDGSMGSTSRSKRGDRVLKDDRVIARAIAMFLHFKEPLPTYREAAARIRKSGGMVSGI